MKSRYDLMQFSEQRADDGTFYPDIMTFPIQKFKFNEAPLEYYVTQQDIDRPDLLMSKVYGVTEFDDIVFWLNGIENIFDLPPNSKLYIPSRADMERFFLDNRR